MTTALQSPACRSRVRIALGSSWPLERQLEFVREQIGLVRQTLDLSGLRGSRARLATHLADGPQAVSGDVVLEPTLDDLVALLPYILGGQWSPSDSPHYACTLTESVPEFLLIADRQGAIAQYDGCKIVRARLTALSGKPLHLQLAIEGLTATQLDSVELPTTGPLAAPLVLHSAHITLDDAPWECAHTELTIENIPLLDRYVHSLSRVDLPIIDRTISLRCQLANHGPSTEFAAGHSWVGALSLRFLTSSHDLELRVPHVRFVVTLPATDSDTHWGLVVEGQPGALPGQSELLTLHSANNTH